MWRQVCSQPAYSAMLFLLGRHSGAAATKQWKQQQLNILNYLAIHYTLESHLWVVRLLISFLFVFSNVLNVLIIQFSIENGIENHLGHLCQMPWISTQYLSFFFSPCPPFFLCFLPPPTWGLTSIFLVLLPFGFRLGLANGRKWQEVSGQRREWLGYYFPIWSVPWLWDDCVTYEYSSRWVPALLVLGFIGLNHTISSLFL